MVSGVLAWFISDARGLLGLTAGVLRVGLNREVPRQLGQDAAFVCCGTLLGIGTMDGWTRFDFVYRFFDKIAPLIEKGLVYPEYLSEAERRILGEIDGLLSWFVLAAHQRHSENTRTSRFRFWFESMMSKPGYCVLRLYLLSGCGSIPARPGRSGRGGVAPGPADKARVYLAAYGTLMTGQVNDIPETMPRLMSVGQCRIAGRMFRIRDEESAGVKDYPAVRCPRVRSITDNTPWVHGELFDIGYWGGAAVDVLKQIDAYECFLPDHQDKSDYIRRYVPVYDAERRRIRDYAWVYYYNGKTDGLAPIPDGRWKSDAAGGASGTAPASA